MLAHPTPGEMTSIPEERSRQHTAMSTSDDYEALLVYFIFQQRSKPKSHDNLSSDKLHQWQTLPMRKRSILSKGKKKSVDRMSTGHGKMFIKTKGGELW